MMAVIRRFCLFVFFSAVMILSSCAVRAEHDQNMVTVSELLEFCGQTEKYTDETDRWTSVNIVEKYADDIPVFFAVIQYEQMWCVSLYRIREENGKIIGLEQMMTGGNEDQFEFDIAELSQGNYIAVYSASHMGNGNLELLPLDGPDVVSYSIPAIDAHCEDTAQTAGEYHVAGKTASAVYMGGKLEAQYRDVDGDANTDIVLKGILQIFSGGEELPEKEYFCNRVYLYDPVLQDFIYSEKDSDTVPV